MTRLGGDSLLEPAVREFVFRRMNELGINQRELADRMGSDESTVSKIVSGRAGASLTLLRRMATALNISVGHLLLAGQPYRPEDLPRPEPTRETAELERLPIYQYAAAGDPTDPDDAPIPVKKEYPPSDKVAIIGNGFGVEVRGSSMTRRGIADGDVVWVNPALRPRVDRPVVAYVRECLAADGTREDGVVVKVYAKREDGRLGLLSDGEQGTFWLECREVRVIGPVVGISSWKTPA